MTLPEVAPPGFIQGYGDTLRQQFVIPLLNKTATFKRISSYFRIGSFVSIGMGLDKLLENKGKMRLLIGDHDLDPRLVEALGQAEGPRFQEGLARLEDKLVLEASTLSTELEKDAVAAVAWMLNDRLLEIKVGTTVSHVATSILHNKRLIFEDFDGNIVAASGSQNETSLTDVHYEEFSAHRSWIDPESTTLMSESFDEAWDGSNPDLRVFQLTESLGHKLLAAVNRPEARPELNKTTGVSGISLKQALTSSHAHSQFSLSGIALFPHQERALVDSFSRLPLRVLLSDEVGLGKTLEAIAVMNTALTFCQVKRIVVIAPPSLLLQWQEELSDSLGQDFLIWRSDQKAYVGPNGDVVNLGDSGEPFKPDSPNFVLISNAIFRSAAFTSRLEEGLGLPDLLVVDEAHAARVRIEPGSGKRRETLLWKQLNRVAPKSEHLLLLTATPVQVGLAELFGLLQLLGLPEKFDRLPFFERSLSWLIQEAEEFDFSEGGLIADALDILLKAYGHSGLNYHPHLQGIVDEFLQEQNPVNRAHLVINRWLEVQDLLTVLHPATQLVVRNTRGSLEDIGYEFPNRVFSAPDLKVSDKILDFHDSLAAYLSDGFGLVEEALGKSKSAMTAFRRSHWLERTSSSLFTAQQSIKNRVFAVEEAAKGRAPELDDDGMSEAHIEAQQQFLQGRLSNQVQLAASSEISYLKNLARIAEEILQHVDGVEPKFQMVKQEILTSINRRRPTLIFSRWVDTLIGCIDYLSDFIGDTKISYGIYTGSIRQISDSNGVREVRKRDLVASLNRGELDVIFCSEAASEGLNLQAAQRLVNIDVPWNPARLEQRIGRIARLGQEAGSVDIVNLWYPGSIEEKIYRRLLERQELFTLAVGRMPGLFDDAIAAAVGGKDALGGCVEDSFEALERIRQDSQSRALNRVWATAVEEAPLSRDFRETIVGFLGGRSAGMDKADVEPGSRDAVTLHSLDNAGLSKTRSLNLLVIQSKEGVVLAFCRRDDSGRVAVVPSHLVLEPQGTFQDPVESKFLSTEGSRLALGEAVARHIQENRWIPDGFKQSLRESALDSSQWSVVEVRD